MILTNSYSASKSSDFSIPEQISLKFEASRSNFPTHKSISSEFVQTRLNKQVVEKINDSSIDKHRQIIEIPLRSMSKFIPYVLSSISCCREIKDSLIYSDV